MSDEELRQTVNRLLMEQQYAKLNPQQVSAGQKFVKKVMNDVVTPAATEVGKNVLKDAMTKAFKNASEASKKKQN